MEMILLVIAVKSAIKVMMRNKMMIPTVTDTEGIITMQIIKAVVESDDERK